MRLRVEESSMRLRLSFALAAAMAALSGSAATAGGWGCPTCYRHVVQPPMYGILAEHVMVHPPRRVTHVIPAQYATMTREVIVAHARRVWQETRDASGHLVGCWVTIPAQVRLEHRHVRVSPGRVVHERMPALYASQPRKVMLEPARWGWQPMSAQALGGSAGFYPGYDPYPF
jgi:hypothetical protein